MNNNILYISITFKEEHIFSLQLQKEQPRKILIKNMNDSSLTPAYDNKTTNTVSMATLYWKV